MPDPTPLRDRLITKLAVAGGWNPNRLEPHDFQDEATAVLAIVQPEVDRYRSAWLSARRRAEVQGEDVLYVTAERDDAREQLTHALAVAAGKIAREPTVIRVEGPAMEATLTTIAVRTAEERADKAEAERDRLRTVARAAAVLLRATADRPSDPAVLRAAAAAIDELAPKETSS